MNRQQTNDRPDFIVVKTSLFTSSLLIQLGGPSGFSPKCLKWINNNNKSTRTIQNFTGVVNKFPVNQIPRALDNDFNDHKNIAKCLLSFKLLMLSTSGSIEPIMVA